jgi:hypothetical protein
VPAHDRTIEATLVVAHRHEDRERVVERHTGELGGRRQGGGDIARRERAPEAGMGGAL